MPSIIEKRIAERQAFRREYRVTYFRSLCISGAPIDMRLLALSEAAEMIEFAKSLIEPLDKLTENPIQTQK